MDARILVVEDDADLGEAMALALSGSVSAAVSRATKDAASMPAQPAPRPSRP